MKPLISLSKAFVLPALFLLLGACQHMKSEPPLEARQIMSEQRPVDCPEINDRCPLVNIDTLDFADEPILNQLIDERLRRMTMNSPDAVLPHSLQSYRRGFLRDAESGWASYLQAKLREQHGNLVIIELSSYLYTGGAHGMPGRGFINYDRELQRELKLEDMLLPGKEGAFWRLAEQAHQRWKMKSQQEQDMDFLADWPFQQTTNIALLKDSVLLKYDVYSIAPYSSGHPELNIDYEDLKGVLKPEYFPEA